MPFCNQHAGKTHCTYPNERILGVSNSGEGAEVEDEDELGLLQGKCEMGKSRVLDAGTWDIRYWGSGAGGECSCQARQSTCHLA